MGDFTMKEIIDYLVNEKGVTMIVATVLAKSFEKYPEIKQEFISWIKERNFKEEDAIKIEGYTAKRIHEIAPELDASGVYQFMITLRENPQKAKEYIQKGFPRK